MDNRRIIQDSIDYIEENLKTEITAQELADTAGFSIFHYYKLFQLAVGIPVMQYIVRRKLLNAVYEISCGRKMIDAALEYGFDTYAGFYKAFRREFGCAPSVFLKKNKMQKPCKLNLMQEERIMITRKKLRDILKHWNLEHETIADVYYESSGYKNDHAFYIGDRYVFKFTVNLGSLNKHIQLSESLRNAGLCAAVPVRTVDGRKIIEVGELYCCVTERIQGRQLNAEDLYEEDPPLKARFVGEIIGHLHAALKNIDAVIKDSNLYEDVTTWALPTAAKVMELPESFCRDHVNALGEVYDKLPKQIIHRDSNPGNIILSNGKWGFIDFELSERNIRIYDPCYAATAILSESFAEHDSKKLEEWITIYKNIIRGYDSVAGLSKEEREAIPCVILANQLIFVAWLSGQEEYRELLEVNRKMTEWIIGNFASLQLD